MHEDNKTLAYTLLEAQIKRLQSHNADIQEQIDHFSNDYKRLRELFMENEKTIDRLEKSLLWLAEEEE